MKYAIGDVVRVRSLEDMWEEFGKRISNGMPCTNLWFADEMKIYCGGTYRIKNFEDDYYILENIGEGDNNALDNWMWSDEMLEDPSDSNTPNLVKETKIPSDVFNEFFSAIPADEKKISSEEMSRLIDEGRELLGEYGYNSDYIDDVLEEWAKSKANLIGLFKKHPNYNGNFQIAFDSDYERPMDYETIENAMAWMHNNCVPNPNTVIYPCFTRDEVQVLYDKCSYIERYMSAIKDYGGDPVVNGHDIKYYTDQKNKWALIYHEMCDNQCITYQGKVYKDNKMTHFKNLTYKFYLYPKSVKTICDSEMVGLFNEYLPEVKAREGQRFMKVFGKAAKMVGLDKVVDWGKQIARLGDAVTPLKIKRHTVLSVNPIDYWTMSFGDTWASCHTIDKGNQRDMPNSYEGQYSAGTESYMLDRTSFIYYTVDAAYDGNKYELQPKCTRQMYHIGEDKLVQGRLYPQGNDGAEAAYKETREIVQKVIADCFGVPNYWKLEKGNDACARAIYKGSCVLNYCDYFEYDVCNVSYLKTEGKIPNANKIRVGCEEIICPSCGKWHDYQNCICCENCYNAEEVYCEYHGCYERLSEEDYTYISGYGNVCYEALENSDDFHFQRCERCGEWFYTESDDSIYTRDGHWYCDCECAERDGYRYCTSCGDWVYEDEFAIEHSLCINCLDSKFEHCDHCDTYVLNCNFDYELDMCDDCAENQQEIDEVA